MFKLKIGGLNGGDVTQKPLYFVAVKNPSITGTFLIVVSSGQATGIKIVYLNSSKNGDFADMNIIYKKLVF